MARNKPPKLATDETSFGQMRFNKSVHLRPCFFCPQEIEFRDGPRGLVPIEPNGSDHACPNYDRNDARLLAWRAKMANSAA
jgi:hypothetical protein